jgi:hypothetical protein
MGSMGHVTVTGYLDDQSIDGSRLTFVFEMDQTYLRQSMKALDAIMSEAKQTIGQQSP